MPAHPSTCPPQPVENELAAGWQAVVDPSSGQTYYQNHATHATQWRKPTAEDGMVGGLSFGQVVVDVNGGAFGILPGTPGMGNMQNRMMRQASLAMGSGQTQPGGPGDQSNNPTQEFEEDASSWDKAQAVLSFGYALGERALFIVLSVLKGGSFTLFLFLIDVLLLGFYGHRGVYEDKARYCPGCLYNDLHVLIKGKKLKGIFVSLKTKRFSGTKKFIVGMAALATITQVVENVSDNWCILQDFEGSPSKMWNSKPGLQWQDAGERRSYPDPEPDGWPGRELTDPKLAITLNKAEFGDANKVQFTVNEMEGFGLNDLGDGIFFVKSDNKFFESKALPTKTKLEVIFFFVSILLIISNIPKMLVAFAGIGTFYMFMTLLYCRFYLSVFMSLLLCKAENELNKQKEAQRNSVDQRGVLQRMGSIVSDRYSKDNVNERKVSQAQSTFDSLTGPEGDTQKKCYGFRYPDMGSNSGTKMYRFWALIWESL
eukprot:CAMPEP_0179432578 /NCGR_PEP_ID=MMETSP0799-20121207/17166_1 /TAXON_ID=46947 /ORGANISM="Geminigera cryophila, Strain CCMP2564" /LENGTH=484 /DNA_ID=CAMNT_0021210045 /DNA_START=847 /DNA_END=2301 /DNA_ORIENTATION=-